jgi:hypothetical protein
LDACEAAGVPPVIKITVDPDSISVADNGLGMAPETVERIIDYSFKTSSNSVYSSPTRGQQGNAFQTVLAMAHALTGNPGVTVLESRGIQHRVTFDIDPISREPRLDHQRTEIVTAPGTKITLTIPITADDFTSLHNVTVDFWWANPHLTLSSDTGERSFSEGATDASWTKWKPSDPTSAHWYDDASLKTLLAAEINRAQRSGSAQRTVADFIGDFRGLAGTAKRRDLCEKLNASRQSLDAFFARGDADIRRLLSLMKAASRSVRPADLGALGEEHVLGVVGGEPESSRYKRTELEVGGIPYLIETGFGYHPNRVRRQKVIALNWSAAIGSDPFRNPNGEGLGSILTDQRCGPDSRLPASL